MRPSKLFAGAICMSLVLSTPAAGNPMLTQPDDRRPSTAGTSAAPTPLMAAQYSAPSLVSNDSNIIFLDHKPQRKSVSVFDSNQGVNRGGGISEGIKLEMVIWGGGGAIIGSLAGPVGTVIGAAAGSLIGLTIGIIMPRKQSSPKFRG